jgi:hypothetical protein
VGIQVGSLLGIVEIGIELGAPVGISEEIELGDTVGKEQPK